ncbi:glycosyltransferase [Candidatus Gottesmanbacteria bacterium]|nr:glycosyltransferase [Candidatus Gottesmanbacteria bacterium]
MVGTPKISVISPSKNTGRFAKETIGTILDQTYTNWEHIVVDGQSTDETISVFKKYKHIRMISEKDSGPDEAFRKGLVMARGEYVMLCCISDGYLDSNWFRKCADILENNHDISLVWGLPQYMSEIGYLSRITREDFFDNPPPGNREFLNFWLKTYFHLPEGNFCIRKRVMDECFPIVNAKNAIEACHFLTFDYNFNVLGYLPYFIPVVANYGRVHADAMGQLQLKKHLMQGWVKKYQQSVDLYKEKLLEGKIIHHFRNGMGKIL